MTTATIQQWERVINAWVSFPDPARSEQHYMAPRTPEHRRSLIRMLRRLGVTQFRIQ